jgi:chromosome partitioning protein
MLLVVGGIKGGTGKTTVSTNLAVCRSLLGKKVLFIDADEQGSGLDWCNQRNMPPEFALTSCALSGKKILSFLEKNKDLYDDIIIDTGGRDTVSQRAALISCDVFLAPFRPRSLDIWTIPTLKQLNDEIRQVNRKFRALAVLNQCEPRGSDKESVRKIMEDSGIDCLKGELGYRKAFSDACSFGLGVIELKTADDKSRKEILILHDDIYKGNMLNTYKSHGKDI